MATQTYTGYLVVKTCPSCGVVYGLDREFDQMNNERSRSWYCPNGHSLVFTESKLQVAEKRAEQLERQRDLARRERDRETENAEHARFRARAEKAAKTRLKNRIAKGVCPCCNRHFANVQKHIEGQHPEYAGVHDTKKDG